MILPPTAEIDPSHVIPHESWPDGPWRDEPDKVIWVDEATGLDCMIVRNKMGTWCGYAGVGVQHPWHGVTYGGCLSKHTPLTLEQRQTEAQEAFDATKEAYTKDPTDLNKSALSLAELSLRPFIDPTLKDSLFRNMDRWDCLGWDHDPRCQTPESIINVHGGLTYSDSCQGVICHQHKEGREGDVWWFGFDHGHYVDLSPEMETSLAGRISRLDDKDVTYDPITGVKHEFGMDIVYRDMFYVIAEVESLAQQLKEQETKKDG